jgi:hypothetical protein
LRWNHCETIFGRVHAGDQIVADYMHLES